MKDVSRVFIFLLLLSFLIHFIGFISWHTFKPDEAVKESVRHITISIQQHRQQTSMDEVEVNPQKETVEVPEPPIVEETIEKEKVISETLILPDEYFAGDEIESANQDDESVTEINQGANVATEKAKSAEQKGGGVVVTESESEQSAISGVKNETGFLENFGGAYNTFIGLDEESNDSVGEEEQGLRSIQENVSDNQFPADQLGNYQLLSDQELDGAFVKDPFTEKKAKELKIINIYFKQISDVIFANWDNPLSPAEMKEKTFVRVRLQLNRQGFLEAPGLHIQSKFPKLDQSLLAAVRASMSHRFDIPESYLEKYAHLTLSWSSDGSEYELMPFEKETKTKE